MLLALSTDFGSPAHWQRLVTYATAHRVQRLVFWGDYSAAAFTAPFTFPSHPGWLNEAEIAERGRVRHSFSGAGEMCRAAGLEFWYVYQVLMLPPRDRLQAMAPHLFNATGEPDMSGQAIYDLMGEQIEELLTLSPNLGGLELWVMECANIVISHLVHQAIPLEAICQRIVETVYQHCRAHGLGLAVDLHTAGGHEPMREGLLTAARTHPDIIVSGDNVCGDFQLHLPFNPHLWRAAVTNPVQVHFDLNGEYWGRNYYPTCALQQYAEHLTEARSLGAAVVNGRISTGHDRWSPHLNVLPAHRSSYTAFDHVVLGDRLPTDAEVCCFDTLGGFNAEYFCQAALESGTDALETVRAFICTEFGSQAADLASVLVDVERVAARVFYADHNYFNAQSVLPAPMLAHYFGMDLQFTTPAGEIFLSLAQRQRDHARLGQPVEVGNRAAFAGWPVPLGVRAIGAQALIAEKQQALLEAQRLAQRADQASALLDPEARVFITRQFEDFVFYARAAATLLEAMVHYYHLVAGLRCEEIPSVARLSDLTGEMRNLAASWHLRQPHDEWHLASALKAWQDSFTKVLAGGSGAV